MKNNKEFLEGVYRKAEILEREKVKKEPKRSIPYQRYIRFSTVAAIFIILPLLFFKSQMGVHYTEIGNIQPRIVSINDPISNFVESDFIVIGETKKIEDSIYVKEGNYIYTDIIISVDQVFLGEIGKDEIRIRVNGGKVKKEKIFSKMEGEFQKGERSLLFLYKDGDGLYYLVNNGESKFKESGDYIFIDGFGNKYTLEDIKKHIKRR